MKKSRGPAVRRTRPSSATSSSTSGKSNSPKPRMPRYRSDFDHSVVHGALRARGFVPSTEVHDAEGWELWWASTYSARDVFGLGGAKQSSMRLRRGQLINHFPNHHNLTRKDLLFRNMSAHIRSLEREGVRIRSVLPQTFYLPRDYRFFVGVYKANPGTVWIAKPAGRAQGRGIFLVTRLAQLRRFAQERAASDARGSPRSEGIVGRSLSDGGDGGEDDDDDDDDDDGYFSGRKRAKGGRKKKSGGGGGGTSGSASDAYILSRYIDRPLLVGGRKFDLRLYVVTVSFRPLVALIHRCGFARFCVFPYEFDASVAEDAVALDPKMHLTNVAVQKRLEGYSSTHGGKWSLASLMEHVEATRGREAGIRLRASIRELIILSLLAVRPKVSPTPHSFELYGYDIIIDETLNPWLVEVNASPSLSATTPTDRALKVQVVGDAAATARAHQRGVFPLPPPGTGFQPLIDERTLLSPPSSASSPSTTACDASSAKLAPLLFPHLLLSPSTTTSSATTIPQKDTLPTTSSSSSLRTKPSALARTVPRPSPPNTASAIPAPRAAKGYTAAATRRKSLLASVNPKAQPPQRVALRLAQQKL